jgi:calcineurin-like phosphoesterase family protein
MSGRTWVAADHHFGHANILNFKRDDGTPLRPFKSQEEHDETIIKNHNNVVSHEDRVYMLGDVCIRRPFRHLLGRLNGRLVLVKGNHDIFKLEDYKPYFDDIRSYVVQKDHDGNKVILSHIPIHPESVGRFGTNIHGHLHYQSIDDPRYVCVSLEHLDYAPIEVHQALKMRGMRKL